MAAQATQHCLPQGAQSPGRIALAAAPAVPDRKLSSLPEAEQHEPAAATVQPDQDRRDEKRQPRHTATPKGAPLNRWNTAVPQAQVGPPSSPAETAAEPAQAWSSREPCQLLKPLRTPITTER